MLDLSRTIHAVKEPDGVAYTYYPVLVVGAGESGIAMGCRLKQVLGFDQFRIFDRQSGLGGTWWINRYPGVACDVTTLLYSFSFSPNPEWTSFFPPGPEIVQYLEDVVAKYQIKDKIQLDTDVSELRWLEEEQLWEATLRHMAPATGDLSDSERQARISVLGHESVYLRHEVVRAKVVVSAVGGLVEPKGWPEHIPGRETFEGKIFHSARWNYDVDLNGKDVIVVGTGCSAAQFMPLLTEAPLNAKSVTQVMRSPPWVFPRSLPPFGEEKWNQYSPKVFRSLPGLARLLRTLIFLAAEYDFQAMFKNPGNPKFKKRKEMEALKYLRNTVPEKYHEILTPDYGVGCKRRIFDHRWFSSLNDPKIHLTTQPLTSIQPKGVTLGPGRTYPDPKRVNSKAPTDEIKVPADIIILANGFDLKTWLHPLKVRGKEGKILQDVWNERGGAQAYMGAAMDGFPNFFIIFGPNTATGHSSVIIASENMVNYSLKFIGPILQGDVKMVEVKKEAEVAWTNDMQEKLGDTVWTTGGCHSWYKNDQGWNSTVYPYSQIDYSIRCMFPNWKHWDIAYTGKGLLKRRTKQALQLFALILFAVGTYQLRQQNGSWKTLPAAMAQCARQGLMKVLGYLDRGILHFPR